MIKTIKPLKGPLMVFGGPYGNYQATTALLAEAKRRAIAPQNIVCTGDITAYCGNPYESAQLIRQSAIHVIQGNCEESLAQDISDCGCGYDTASACAALSDLWYNFSRIETPKELKDWMGSLPLRLEFTLAGKRFHVLHGSTSQINAFIYPSTAPTLKKAEIEKTGADIIIAGHSGIPFTEKIDDKVWHNAGVIGLPANDGTPRVWYSLIEEREGALAFTHHALHYDYQGAAKRMIDVGLSDYATTLSTGLYPTLDSLPEQERMATGKPLAPQFMALPLPVVTAK